LIIWRVCLQRIWNCNRFRKFLIKRYVFVIFPWCYTVLKFLIVYHRFLETCELYLFSLVREEIEIFDFIFAFFDIEWDFLLGLLLRLYNSIAKNIQFFCMILLLYAWCEVLIYIIINHRIQWFSIYLWLLNCLEFIYWFFSLLLWFKISDCWL